MTKPLRVLFLEDSVSDEKLIRPELQRAGLIASVSHVDTENDSMQAVSRLQPDVVLCDHAIAGFGSSTALTIVRTMRAATPFIVKTVESHRSEVMKRLGTHDVVGLVRYAVRIGLVRTS